MEEIFQSWISNFESNISVAMWMDLKIVMLIEVRETEKEKYHMTPLIYGI